MEKKNFAEIFRYTDENKVEKKIPIVIPMIQRDYVQGRSSATEIRKSLVKATSSASVQQGPTFQAFPIFGLCSPSGNATIAPSARADWAICEPYAQLSAEPPIG